MHRVASKATRVLNLLRHSLFGCHSTVISSLVYIVRPHLEYAILIPPLILNFLRQFRINCAAHWICATWVGLHTCGTNQHSRTEMAFSCSTSNILYLHSMLHCMNFFSFSNLTPFLPDLIN